jgi:hypothetical protein
MRDLCENKGTYGGEGDMLLFWSSALKTEAVCSSEKFIYIRKSVWSSSPDEQQGFYAVRV